MIAAAAQCSEMISPLQRAGGVQRGQNRNRPRGELVRERSGEKERRAGRSDVRNNDEIEKECRYGKRRR